MDPPSDKVKEDYITKLVLSTFGRSNRRLSYQKFADNRHLRSRFVSIPNTPITKTDDNSN